MESCKNIINKVGKFSQQIKSEAFKRSTLSMLKYSLLVFALLFLWLNYEDEWLSVFGKYVCPYLFVSPKGWVTAIWIIITILFVVFVAIKLCEICKRRTQLTANQTIMLLFVCVVYVKYRFFSELCERYGDTPIAYLDAYALLTVAFVLIGFRNYFSPRKKSILTTESEPFIPDKPVKNAQEDKLGYSDVAEQLVNNLSALSLDESISIGVVAPWGAGKTSFMNIVKDLLSRKDFVVINFNPRNSKNIHNIQEDFFSVLCAALSPYHFGMSSVLKPYMKALQLMEENKLANLFSFFYGLQDKETAKEDVKAVLKGLPKKVIIFIDDLDRLLIEEILEVFKIIDGNASFPNVVFVTAYDKSSISKMLGEHLCIGNNQDFIDKFFEYEIIVPLRPKHKLFSYLKYEILERCGYSKEKTKVHETIIDSVEELISEHIVTMRDAKRLINMFVSDYKQIEGDVDFGDFLLVSVIKYLSPEEHRRIYFERPFLELSSSHRLYLLCNDFDEIYKNYPFRKIVKSLFFRNINDSEENPYGRIYYANAFDSYFITRIEGRLPQRELNDLLVLNDLEQVKEKFSDWAKEKMLGCVVEYLATRNIYKFANRELFANYVRASLLVCDAHTDVYSFLAPIFYKSNVSRFIPFYKFEDEDEYEGFIKDCLRKIPNSCGFTQKLLLNKLTYRDKENPSILRNEELLDINKGHLSYYLGKESGFGDKHYNALCSCITKVDMREGMRAILDEKCCKHAKEAIIKNPSWYIENFVRVWQDPFNTYKGNIFPEEHWEDIFGEKIAMEQFINDEKHNTCRKIKRVRNCWKLYKYNDYRAITIEGEWNVKQLLDNDLDEMMKELTKLEKIDNKFQEIKSKMKNGINNDLKSQIKQDIDMSRKDLNKNKLNIAYKKKLRGRTPVLNDNHPYPLT